MVVFALSFFFFALVMAGLAIGVLFGRKALRGSCGGDAVIDVCPLCSEKEEP